MASDPLLTTLLDIAVALPDRELMIGGGYGLYLKQKHLQKQKPKRTLFEAAAIPAARTTEDIDWILTAEIVTDSASMREIRGVLDTLGFDVVETARYTQFWRPIGPGHVKVDLLAAPLGEYARRVKPDPRRVKPKPAVELHASKLEEALAVERNGLQIEISGELSSGEPAQTVVLIPQAFSYLLMKLFAFRDRMQDVSRLLGQHHALDLYRIVGLITQDEYDIVQSLSREFAGHPIMIEAAEIAHAHFIAPLGIGRIRIREHPLYSPEVNIDRFAEELSLLLAGDAML